MATPKAPADKPKPDNPDKPDKAKRSPRPPRGKNRFNERELARAVRAAVASGAERVDVDPASGKFSVILPAVILPGKVRAAGNALDQWMAKHARPSEGH